MRENPRVKVCDGNKAAAYGVLLCKPDVIAIYPITPQTPLAEQVSRFQSEGLLDSEIIEVEGENSAMSSVIGASAAGGRVFTATSSWGLVFMYDALLMAAGQRTPIVMVNVNRETPHLMSVTFSRQDIMSVRDSGWIQIELENCQEILDSIIMGYRLAEDPDILLPVMVSYDGIYLSHFSERVEIPHQRLVDRFLAPLLKSKRMKLSSGESLSFFTSCTGRGDLLTEYRYKHCAALERAKVKLEDLREDFKKIFGREYSGAIEQYKTDDADILLVAMGSSVGTARVVVDQKRKEGLKIGLVKIKMFRPFPSGGLYHVLKGRKAIGILDRSVCLGWNCGHLYMELAAAMGLNGLSVPMLNFIAGLGGLDITLKKIGRAIDLTQKAGVEGVTDRVFWIDLE